MLALIYLCFIHETVGLTLEGLITVHYFMNTRLRKIQNMKSRFRNCAAPIPMPCFHGCGRPVHFHDQLLISNAVSASPIPELIFSPPNLEKLVPDSGNAQIARGHGNYAIVSGAAQAPKVSISVVHQKAPSLTTRANPLGDNYQCMLERSRT